MTPRASKPFTNPAVKPSTVQNTGTGKNAASITELRPSVQLQDDSSTNPGGTQVWAKQNSDEALGAWDKHLSRGCGKGPLFYR